MTANKPMTGEQLDELMTVAVNMQRDSEKAGDRPTAMFAYAVQVAVLEIRKVRLDVAALAAENSQMLRLLTDISDNHEEYVNQDEYLYAGVPMDYVSEINAYVSRDVEAENPFKETDAFLAEVRASAVDSLIGIKINQLERMHPDTHAFGATAAFIRSQINELQSFAALLRKGVQS